MTAPPSLAASSRDALAAALEAIHPAKWARTTHQPTPEETDHA